MVFFTKLNDTPPYTYLQEITVRQKGINYTKDSFEII